MRTAEIRRDTAETRIALSLTLEGSGTAGISTGCGFFDHMLTLFAAHGRFDLAVDCDGDMEVDAHHTVEDVGICLGRAFAEALGSKAGITRYGDILLPMDESLVAVAVDISGRGGAFVSLPTPACKVGDFDCELAEEFLVAFARESGITVHARLLCGGNSHHILEAAFKGLGRALKAAVAEDAALCGGLPSTKGVL
ncbi:MAG: imidazoleglycerol-phosphate dehydratase HisB [Clostridia bacterium]|nr:imidazoleglycerol-phosphate dehydratase HisB [Clostridia bacterium]